MAASRHIPMGSLALFALLRATHACTTIVAKLGGTTFTTHTADCPDCDFRLAKIKRRVLPSSGTEEVMMYRRQYPREVSTRAKTWDVARLRGPTAAHVAFWSSDDFQRAQRAGNVAAEDVDAIAKQVGGLVGGATSLSYYEALFAIANEAGVTVGESTCYAALSAAPADPARDAAAGFAGAIYDIAALSRVALERCATARCAVRLMGLLAEAGGYYAAGTAGSEGGEGLSVADGDEGWMFHILPANTTDGKRASAVWAAMRVRDGEAVVCANAFVIRGVPAADGFGADGRDYLVSTNMVDAATHHELHITYTSDGELDFYATYGGGSDPYNLKRQWRIYDRLAPSLELQPDDAVMAALHDRARRERVPFAKTDAELGDTGEFPAGVWPDLPKAYRDRVQGAYYPVAVAIETMATPTDAETLIDAANVVASLMREIYAGTKFDASLDLRGGAFGDPEELPGAPRRVSIQRTSFWHVGQSSLLLDRRRSTVLRYGQYSPHVGPFVPLLVAGDEEPPAELTSGSLFEAPAAFGDATGAPRSLFWAAALLGGWSRQFFRVAQPEVAARRDAVEAANDAALLAALRAGDGSDASFAKYNGAAAARATSETLDAFAAFVVKYRDGYVVTDRCGAVDDVTAKCDACPEDNPSSSYDISTKSMTYLDWWKAAVNPPAPFPPALVAEAPAATSSGLLAHAATFSLGAALAAALVTLRGARPPRSGGAAAAGYGAAPADDAL